MNSECGISLDKRAVVAGFHSYGYTVDVYANGEVIHSEEYGNSPYDSTNVIATRVGRTAPLSEIESYARITAAQLAEEHGVANEKVSVFRDTDAERELRSMLGDDEVET